MRERKEIHMKSLDVNQLGRSRCRWKDDIKIELK
jgi:hypothetical protein